MTRLQHDASQSTGNATAPRHVDFLGIPFCLLPAHDVLDLIMKRLSDTFRYVVTPNASHVAAIHDDPARLLPLYRAAWLSLCDSQILRALAKFERQSLPLVTGSDLVAALLATLNAAPTLHRILIVGPARDVEHALRARYPNVALDVVPAPQGLARDAQLRLNVARDCIDRPWDILLLCVGSPAQELIAYQIAQLGGRSGVALCVGAAVDFLTGQRKRAPQWMRKVSLEWAFRLAQEPHRLWRRYLLESPKIFRVFIATRSLPRF